MKSCPPVSQPVLCILLCQAIIISIGTTQHSKLTGHCHQNWWKPANVLPHSTWSSPFTLSSLSCLSDEFITFVHIIKLCQWLQRHPVQLLFPLSDCLCAAIVQLEAIKNVDKIISNSIYILKDNLPFTGTNNIINSINLPVLPLCLRCVAIHRCRCRIWNLSCGAARCLFTFLPSLSLPVASLALLQFVSNWNSANIFEFVCLATLWPRFQSALLQGTEGFRFHGCPQRAHFTFASNIHRLPWLLLLLAAALVVAVVASCPRGGARLAPTVLIFIHSVNMQIARPEPGLACLPWWQQGEPLHHKLQLCWPNSRSSASLPQNLFGQMFFFPCFLANQTCCRTSHSPDDTIFGMKPGAVPDTDTGIMCWPR